MDNPYELIKKAGLNKTELGAEAGEILSKYDEAITFKDQYPENVALQQMAEKAIKKTNETIQKLIRIVLEQKKSEEDKEKETTAKKERSKKAMEEVEIDEKLLDECRKLEATQKAKRAKSRKKPVKKTRRTKLKERALSIIRLTPADLVGDEKVQKTNRKIVEMIIRECMKNWKMNQVRQTQDAAKKQLDEIQEKAQKEEPQEKKKAAVTDYLVEAVKELKKNGIKVKQYERQTDTEDASIELSDNFDVQVLDHYPRKPTFILNEFLEDRGSFRHSEELLSVEALIKKINETMNK